jgi:hypothetical protein
VSQKPQSSLLIAEPPLLVLPSLAMAIGLNEAIFLQQLHYWLLRSEHHRDDRAWVYNTYEEWHQQLPFWSLATLRRIVGALEKQGLVISTTQYNRHKVDRTKWYSLDYQAIDRLRDSADHVLNLSSPSDQTEQMQPLNMSKSEPETTQRLRTERLVEDSNGPTRLEKYDGDRDVLANYIRDFAGEFADQASLTSSTTRAQNLYQRSGLALDRFINVLYAARAITKERSGGVREVPDESGRKARMAYFFSVVEDLLKQELPATGTGSD